MRLEAPEASERRGAQEDVEFEARAAREHVRHKTREVQIRIRHVRQQST